MRHHHRTLRRGLLVAFALFAFGAFGACGDGPTDPSDVDGADAVDDIDGGVLDASDGGTTDAGSDATSDPIPFDPDAGLDATPSPVVAPESGTFVVNLGSLGPGTGEPLDLELEATLVDGSGEITRATLRSPAGGDDIELAETPVPVVDGQFVLEGGPSPLFDHLTARARLGSPSFFCGRVDVIGFHPPASPGSSANRSGTFAAIGPSAPDALADVASCEPVTCAMVDEVAVCHLACETDRRCAPSARCVPEDGPAHLGGGSYCADPAVCTLGDEAASCGGPASCELLTNGGLACAEPGSVPVGGACDDAPDADADRCAPGGLCHLGVCRAPCTGAEGERCVPPLVRRFDDHAPDEPVLDLRVGVPACDLFGEDTCPDGQSCVVSIEPIDERSDVPTLPHGVCGSTRDRPSNPGDACDPRDGVRACADGLVCLPTTGHAGMCALPCDVDHADVCEAPAGCVTHTMTAPTGQHWGTCLGTCDPFDDADACDAETPCTVFARGFDEAGTSQWLGRCAASLDGAEDTTCEPAWVGPTPCDEGLVCILTYVGGYSFANLCVEPCTADDALTCSSDRTCRFFIEDGPIGVCE